MNRASTRMKISSNFSRPGRSIFLVSLTQFLGEPLQRGCKIHWWENFVIFDKSPFISETVRDMPFDSYGTLVGSHRRPIDHGCQFRWPWVTHNPGFKVKSNLSKTVRLRDRLTIDQWQETILSRMVPLSITLNDLWSRSQGQDIFWSRMSEKRRVLATELL